MCYCIKQLSPELYLITWDRAPIDPQIEERFLKELQDLVQTAPHPIYTLSDLRKGCIRTVETIRRLAQITQHENWGGGTAFGSNPSNFVFVGLFARLNRKEKPIAITFDQALATLESLKPGLTHGIDWGAFVSA